MYEVIVRGEMDGPTFAVEITKAIVWPTTTVIVAILFRKPLSGLIPALRSLKYKELEVKFSKGVEELRHEAIAAIPNTDKETSSIKDDNSSSIQLAEISPRYAVLDAWRKIESEAIACIGRNKLNPEQVLLKGHSRIGHALFQAGVLNNEQVKLFHKLSELRNLASHADDFALGVEDAIDYIESAMRLAEHLKSS